MDYGKSESPGYPEEVKKPPGPVACYFVIGPLLFTEI